MAQAALVDQRIDDGLELLKALAHSNLAVTAAAWVRPEVDDDWQLHLAVPDVSRRGRKDAYYIVQDAIRNQPDSAIGLLDVRVIDSASELAREIQDIAQRRPLRPTYCHGLLLGHTEIEEAYVYPIQIP